jgi:hypothetical protein
VNTTLTFDCPSTVQLLHNGRINFFAPLLKALIVLCAQDIVLLSVLLRGHLENVNAWTN